ncbi:hypothetical protein J40TS1_22880 [Paenibacillus montaniterrae]|uniref:Uncharacterized protein n=1 Tax=Paenibacillus montaniterrae TaxID=429341 RepID=A0A919YST2_9BACL|nr:hypothetical protein J40TS1_22880 [Paenibacillus montaniterrae]
MFKKQDFDDDVTSLLRIRRRILNASENSGAHVGLSTLRSSFSTSVQASWS